MFSNPLVLKFISSFVRWGIGPVIAYLIGKGIVSVDEGGQYVSALTDPAFLVIAITFLGQLGWSWWEKYNARQKLVTAMAAPTTMTELAVEAVVKAGASPSTATPKDEVPKPTPPTP